MSIKFNIGSVHDSSCPERPLLRKATKKIEDGDFVQYRRGLIAYMILEQQMTPSSRNEKYRDKPLHELQRILVRKLIKLGYDFGEQSPEAQDFINLQKISLGITTEDKKVEPPATKETTYSQTRTVTVVLERKGFNHEQARRATESFSGADTIEKMKTDGFKVLTVTYNQAEGKTSANGGLGFFGWKEEN